MLQKVAERMQGWERPNSYDIFNCSRSMQCHLVNASMRIKATQARNSRSVEPVVLTRQAADGITSTQQQMPRAKGAIGADVLSIL